MTPGSKWNPPQAKVYTLECGCSVLANGEHVTYNPDCPHHHGKPWLQLELWPPASKSS